MALVVTIFSAVQTEAKAIAKAVSAPVPIPSLPVHSTFGSLKIIHHLIGIKAAGLPNLSIDSDTRYILLAGLAGALDPSLAVGDLVLCDCPERFSTRIEIQRGLIHTGVDVAATPAQKAELFASTQARVVDMETAVVRTFAARREIPFVCLRAVSDSAAERALRRMPRSETVVMLATVVVTVLSHNLAIGVVVGVLVAMTLFARRVAHLTETR